MSTPDFYYDLYSQQWEFVNKVRPRIVIDLTEEVIDLTVDDGQIQYTPNATLFLELTKEDSTIDCDTSIGRRSGEFLFLFIYLLYYVIIFFLSDDSVQPITASCSVANCKADINSGTNVIGMSLFHTIDLFIFL